MKIIDGVSSDDNYQTDLAHVILNQNSPFRFINIGGVGIPADWSMNDPVVANSGGDFGAIASNSVNGEPFMDGRSGLSGLNFVESNDSNEFSLFQSNLFYDPLEN